MRILLDYKHLLPFKKKKKLNQKLKTTRSQTKHSFLWPQSRLPVASWQPLLWDSGTVGHPSLRFSCIPRSCEMRPVPWDGGDGGDPALVPGPAASGSET